MHSAHTVHYTAQFFMYFCAIFIGQHNIKERKGQGGVSVKDLEIDLQIKLASWEVRLYYM